MKTFAAINLGSYELSMKIYEYAKGKGMKEIDHIRHSIELGTDTYRDGKIGYEKVDELCKILREFVTVMKSYQVESYKAYGTSAIRETQNTMIVLDQIRIRTGIEVEVLSNSEQRFLDYKSIASKEVSFHRMIQNPTAIVDIGGGSVQVSLFDNESLICTQNIKMGILRLREKLMKLNPKSTQIEELVEEMINNNFAVFKKLYVKDKDITNIIIVDDYIAFSLQNRNFLNREDFFEFTKEFSIYSKQGMAQKLGVSDETLFLVYLSALIIKQIMIHLNAQEIWAPGVNLCDGIAYDFAVKNNIIRTTHDFDKDIIACARNISKRYYGSKKRGEIMEDISLTLFDSMKKYHGLESRERLLLQIASLLHDCGKYISLVNVGECSYGIVMATEIIGLSHAEREIVANVVRYIHTDFDYYEVMSKTNTIEKKAYLTIAKLTALLRVANGLDRSHKQKFRDIKAVVKEDGLIITVDTDENIMLEKGLIDSKSDFFEEVYSIRPIIRLKRKG